MTDQEKSASPWPYGWIVAGIVSASVAPAFASEVLYQGLSEADRADNHPTDAELKKCPGIVELYHDVRTNGIALPSNVSVERLQLDASECVEILNENYGTSWTVDDVGVHKD